MCCYPKYCSCVVSACSPAGWRSSLAVTTSSRAVTPSGCDVFFYFCNTVSFTWSVEERRERHRGTDGQWVTDEREGERQSASLTFTQWLDSVLHAIRRRPKKKHTVLANCREHTKPNGIGPLPTNTLSSVRSFHSQFPAARELASPHPSVTAPDPSLRCHLVLPWFCFKSLPPLSDEISGEENHM